MSLPILICRSFALGASPVQWSDFQGYVVLHESTLYLSASGLRGASFPAPVLGAAAGILLAIADPTPKLAREASLAFSELPHHLTAFTAWAHLSPGQRVIAVPQSAVTKFSLSLWTGAKATTPTSVYRLNITPLQFVSARRAFTEGGWLRPRGITAQARRLLTAVGQYASTGSRTLIGA